LPFWTKPAANRHAVKIGDRVEISGQGGRNGDWELPESITDKIAQAFRNVERTLSLAGAGREHVIHVNSHHVGYDGHQDEINQTVTERFRHVGGGHRSDKETDHARSSSTDHATFDSRTARRRRSSSRPMPSSACRSRANVRRRSPRPLEAGTSFFDTADVYGGPPSAFLRAWATDCTADSTFPRRK
jgi:enamine deaminase RidA (YjgF/YER057c/UK114 family)